MTLAQKELKTVARMESNEIRELLMLTLNSINTPENLQPRIPLDSMRATFLESNQSVEFPYARNGGSWNAASRLRARQDYV